MARKNKFLFSLCLTLLSLFCLVHSSLIFHLAVKNCMQQFLPQMTTTTTTMMMMWMWMRMANKHAKFSASAFVVVNVPHPTTTAASPYFLLLCLSLSLLPSSNSGWVDVVVIHRTHSEHVWPFSLLSTGDGLFGRFSFLCFMLAWLFSLSLSPSLSLCFFTACIDAFFLLTTRWDLHQQQCRLAREVLLLAGFWAGFNLAKYALNAVYFHCMQLRLFASLLGCLFSHFFLLYFSLLCLSSTTLWLNDSRPQKRHLNVELFMFSFIFSQKNMTIVEATLCQAIAYGYWWS